MKRLFAILFALFCTMPLFCQDREVDSLLRVLDASVQGRERYTLERQSQINALQCQLKATRSDAELLEIYQELFPLMKEFEVCLYDSVLDKMTWTRTFVTVGLPGQAPTLAGLAPDMEINGIQARTRW